MKRFLCVMATVVAGLVLMASIATRTAVLSGSTAPGSTPSPTQVVRIHHDTGGSGCC